MSDVLLIEPDRVLAKTYAQSLTSSNIATVIVNDAQNAIHAMDEVNPKLVVLELQLGEHNGVEFLYEMRSYPDWQSIPVIVFSRLGEQEAGFTAETKKQLGVTVYCYKPATSLDAFIEIVKSQIESSS
jgi:DNA-binding response OmpR family regulator